MFTFPKTYIINILTLYQTILTFNDPKEEGFGKHCRKRRKCRKPAFSPIPIVFSNLLQIEIIILTTSNLLSANALNLDQTEILSFGEELIF